MTLRCFLNHTWWTRIMHRGCSSNVFHRYPQVIRWCIVIRENVPPNYSTDKALISNIRFIWGNTVAIILESLHLFLIQSTACVFPRNLSTRLWHICFMRPCSVRTVMHTGGSLPAVETTPAVGSDCCTLELSVTTQDCVTMGRHLSLVDIYPFLL